MIVINGTRINKIGKPDFILTEKDIPENPNIEMIHGVPVK